MPGENVSGLITLLSNELKPKLECNGARLRCLLDIEKKLREETVEENFATGFTLGWEIRKELQDAGVLSTHGGEDSGTVRREVTSMAKRRPSGDGMVRKRDAGHRESRYTASRDPDIGKIPPKQAHHSGPPKTLRKAAGPRVRRQVARISGETLEALLKTKNSYRALPLAGDTVAVLKEQRKKVGNSPWVFPSPTDAPIHPDSMTDWLSKFSKRHSLPHINPHVFRHAMASMLY